MQYEKPREVSWWWWLDRHSITKDTHKIGMSPDQVTVLVRDRATGSVWEEELTTDSYLDEMNGEDGDEYDSDEEEEQEDEEPDVKDDKG